MKNLIMDKSIIKISIYFSYSSYGLRETLYREIIDLSTNKIKYSKIPLDEPTISNPKIEISYNPLGTSDEFNVFSCEYKSDFLALCEIVNRLVPKNYAFCDVVPAYVKLKYNDGSKRTIRFISIKEEDLLKSIARNYIPNEYSYIK